MEMKYLKVPTADDLESSSSSVPIDEPSPRHSLRWLRRVFRFFNSYLQVTSPAYQQTGGERKVAFFAFMCMFICFIFTSFFVFTGGDVCHSYQQGMERLRAERDMLRNELSLLRQSLPALNEALIPPENPAPERHVSNETSHVIP